MRAYSASCRLTLPRDMVFDYAADPANAAAWIPGVESWIVEGAGAAEDADPGGPDRPVDPDGPALAAGSAIVETRRADARGPRGRRLTVVAVDAPERLVLRTERRFMAYLYDFAFVPLTSGSLVIMNGKVEAMHPALRRLEPAALALARRRDGNLPESLQRALQGSWTPVV